MIRIEAITREEVLLQSIAEGKEVTLEPKTRLEWWLKKIAESGGSGGVSSWNDLTDKPFYKEGATINIEWDGNTDGKTNLGVFYKVSELTPSNDALYNCTLNVLWGGEVATAPSDQLNNSFESDYGIIGDFVIVIRKSGVTINDMTFSETGLYFLSSDGDYVTSLLYTDTIIKTLDKEYLPSVAEQLSEVSEVKKTSIEFDEDLDGKTTVDLGGMYMVKVCDAIPSEESILSGSITILADGTESTIDVSTINSNGRYTNTDDFYVIGDECIIIKNANVGADLFGVNFPEVGVWFAYISSANYVKSLNVEYTETTATYETIPEESIPELSSFTMVSSSGKKYKVTIDDTGTLSATGITE